MTDLDRAAYDARAYRAFVVGGNGHTVVIVPARTPSGGWQSYARCTCGAGSIDVFPHGARTWAQHHVKAAPTDPDHPGGVPPNRRGLETAKEE